MEVFQITPVPDFQDLATNEFVWTNVPFEYNSRENFRIKAIVHSMLGDTLMTKAQITSNQEDVNLSNDTTFCEQIVVGSFDPNDKLVNPLGRGDNGKVSVADSMFNYRIRFQNTGTDTAFTVIVRDTLDSSIFELNSVQPRMSSHRYQLDVEGDNILVFTFDNINLPDSTRNEPASHGFVVFDIALLPNLPLQTFVQNTAAIYFDFNEPIITNTTSNFITSQIDIFQDPVLLKVYPSPLNERSFIEVNLTQTSQNAVLELLTLEGELVQTIQSHTSFSRGETIVPFDTNNLNDGIYLINFRTVNGNAIVKVVKVNE